MTNDSLPAIRDKIKEKVTTSYIFLDTSGNPIQKNNENDYTLEKISIEKVIKIKSEGNDSGIDVFMNDSKVCSVNCSMSQNLSEVRCLISQNIKQDFFFIDTTSSEISKSDENDYNVEDIIQDGSIKLK